MSNDYARRNIIVSELAPAAMRRRQLWCIEQFHLQKQIGSGYASIVYLATCRDTGNQVAIKMYHKSKLTDLHVFQIFREIRIHSKLNHKHIIQLWAAFEDQFAIYLVSEYASKGDVFADVERRGGIMPEADAVRQVLHPFLLALVYLHNDVKIIHRDIKPENLLFSSTGVLKVADFGLSIEYDLEHAVTRVGTLDYMAPEVVVCPDKHYPHDNKDVKHLHYSPVVDSWAVGVMAYELIVGQPPFDRGHKRLTVAEILKGEPTMPDLMPEGAHAFISWALTKNKLMRPTVQQLIEHPWIEEHIKQLPRGVREATRAFGAQMRSAKSFVEPRFHGLKTEQECESSGPETTLHSLQVEAVQQSGRMLGHSLSLSAIDMMRWRDVVAFNQSGIDLHAACMPLRKSDGCDSGPDSLHSPRAMMHDVSSGAVTPAAVRSFSRHPSSRSRDGLMQSPDRNATREEVFASLLASSRSLSACRPLKLNNTLSQSSPQLLLSNPMTRNSLHENKSLMHSPQAKPPPPPGSQSPRAARMLHKTQSLQSPRVTQPPRPPLPTAVVLRQAQDKLQQQLACQQDQVPGSQREAGECSTAVDHHGHRSSAPETPRTSPTDVTTLPFVHHPQPPQSVNMRGAHPFTMSPSRLGGSRDSLLISRTQPTSPCKPDSQSARQRSRQASFEAASGIYLKGRIADRMASALNPATMSAVEAIPEGSGSFSVSVSSDKPAIETGMSARMECSEDSVPALLQSAKDILSGLRKVFS